MDILPPLAHRLGIRAVKEELEDLSLRILDPVAYKEIEDALALRENERSAFLESIQQRIRDRLAEFDMKPFVAGRIKSITGIYRKMYMQGVHGFLGLVPTLLGIPAAAGAHVVQPVRQLDDDHPNIPGHGEEHFAHILRLLFLPGRKGDFIQFGNPVHQLALSSPNWRFKS